MGYVRNKFLIVHGNKLAISAAHSVAVKMLGALVTPIMCSSVNEEYGFTVWTSGSKLGWPQDDEHTKARCGCA